MTGRIAHQMSEDGVLVVMRPVIGSPMFLRITLSEARRFGWALLADVDPDGEGTSPPTSNVVCGPLTLDIGERRAWVHSQPVRLTRREFDVLLAIASEGGDVIATPDLERAVYGDHRGCESNVMDVWLHKLRTKLGEAGAPNIIESRRGYGYRIAVDGGGA